MICNDCPHNTGIVKEPHQSHRCFLHALTKVDTPNCAFAHYFYANESTNVIVVAVVCKSGFACSKNQTTLHISLQELNTLRIGLIHLRYLHFCVYIEHANMMQTVQ